MLMEKINAVLVILDENSLVTALNNLNFGNVNLVAAVMENGDGKFVGFDDKKIPLISFASIQNLLDAGQNFVWLISGTISGVNDVYNVKKFLMDNGVAENNIVNFNLEISMYYIANLRYIEKHGADFFATGDKLRGGWT